MRVVACGLCGSDVEKLDAAHAGAVLGHEVVAETTEGRRVTLVHHASCGECERCLAGHESTCERFAAPTIRPGGFAERLRAEAWVDLPEDWPDWRGTIVEPLACVLRGVRRVPSGRILIVGNGFIGRLFGVVLERRGDDVFAVDVEPRRAGRAPRRAGRRCRPLGPWWRRDGARIRDARRHGARLRRRRRHTGVGGLSPRADRRRDALGGAFVHARGPCAAP